MSVLECELKMAVFSAAEFSCPFVANLVISNSSFNELPTFWTPQSSFANCSRFCSHASWQTTAWSCWKATLQSQCILQVFKYCLCGFLSWMSLQYCPDVIQCWARFTYLNWNAVQEPLRRIWTERTSLASVLQCLYKFTWKLSKNYQHQGVSPCLRCSDFNNYIHSIMYFTLHLKLRFWWHKPKEVLTTSEFLEFERRIARQETQNMANRIQEY